MDFPKHEGHQLFVCLRNTDINRYKQGKFPKTPAAETEQVTLKSLSRKEPSSNEESGDVSSRFFLSHQTHLFQGRKRTQVSVFPKKKKKLKSMF